ncbi:MAG: NlpC/P60 family protein [Candidatus Eiseniibacteriota bacterium]
MSDPRGRAGVVGLPLLDLRREPDHASELLSQMLLGEVADVIAESGRGRWLRVRGWLDGYAGWVRSWGLVRATPARCRRWLKRARHQVRVLHAELRSGPRGGIAVSPLLWRSRVIRRSSRGGHSLLELPDGRLGWLPSASLAPVGAPGAGFIERIQGLSGVPYQWGGRSAVALDCSGFTQLVMSEQGIALPRDARDQWRACAEIGGTDHARVGDLVFFGSAEQGQAHVGLYLGEGYFVHSRGRIGVNSLDPDNILCDNELAAQFRGVGRAPKAWRPRRGKSP